MNKKNPLLLGLLALGALAFIGLSYYYYQQATYPTKPAVSTNAMGTEASDHASKSPAETEATSLAAQPPIGLPDIQIYNSQDEAIDWAQSAAKVNVVNFWATWCHYCEQEMPDFLEVYEMYKDHPDVRFFMVNSGERSENPRPQVEAYLKSHQLEALPVYYDQGSAAFRILRLQGYPGTFLLNEKQEALPLGLSMAGKPYYLHPGLLTKDQLIEYIEENLKR